MLLPAADSDTALAHLLGAAGGSMVMVDTGGGERRGALTWPLCNTPQSRQVKATRGLRAGDPVIPTDNGYLRVLLSQLLVLPLQLCRGHGLPRPVQARLPRPLSPAPRPQPQTSSRVRLRQRLAASPPPSRLLLHFRVRPVGGRRSGTRAGKLPGAELTS